MLSRISNLQSHFCPSLTVLAALATLTLLGGVVGPVALVERRFSVLETALMRQVHLRRHPHLLWQANQSQALGARSPRAVNDTMPA